MPERSLEDLKREYEEVQKRYNFPNFADINRDFSIEKIYESETELLIKEIMKIMEEKFSGYLRFIESILNPVNSPMSIFSLIKSLGQSEKKILSEIYEKLVKQEINALEVDIHFSEEKGARFINDSYELWQGIKKDLLEIVSILKKNLDNKSDSNKAGYFG